ncbi:MAG TPA: PQQ-binding-like beta-propeller repeat protein [Pirellulaceae bacterium]|nr:PQQ-binding-like beta-propeller repeat protein [Pirellulaceae bacterium]
MSYRLAILGIALAALPLAAQDNWPQFRGPQGHGTSKSTGLPTTWSEKEHVKWKTPLHDRGWSSPVIWGDQIWVTAATEEGKTDFAICIDKNTGKIVHDLKLWDNEKVYPLGNALNSYASCTPAIEEGRVYVHFGSYGTACLDTASGKTLWQRRDLPCEHFRGPGSSPILFENLLIFHMDGYDFHYIVALDKQTGNTVWKMDRNIDYGTTNGDLMKSFCTPLVIEAAGKTQLISPSSKACMSYDPRTGREFWRVRYASHSGAAMPLFGHGLVYVNTGFGAADLLAVKPDGEGDVTTTHVVWASKKSIGSKPSQVLVGDLIFNVDDNPGVATCIDAKTGEELWSKRLSGEFSASPLYADGKIYYCGQDGITTVVKADREYTELAKNQFADGFMASPAVTGKALILRTRSAIYRVEE